MTPLYYLAYGSNLHPLRLQGRVPSARLLGTVALPGYGLVFHKRSIDGSAKCSLRHAPAGSGAAHGAVFEIAEREKRALDRCEGNGYRDAPVTVTLAGKALGCFTYIARPAHIDETLRPYCWYKDLVTLGAEYLRLPAPYVSAIRGLAFDRDSDTARRHKHEALIAGLLGAGSAAAVS